MNKYLKYSLFGLGGLVLFLGVFIGVAAMSGAPMHEVAVVGRFFDAPEGTEGTAGEEVANALKGMEVDTSDAATRGHDALERQAGLLGAFQVDSPFTGAELRKLQNEMKSKFRETRDLYDELHSRELDIEERERAVADKYNELADLRTKLEEMESSIALRLSELERDEAAKADRKLDGWKAMAELYRGIEPEAGAAMLKDESAENAAIILKELGAEEAGAILRAVTPVDTRQEFMAAYRKANEAP